MRLAQSEIVSKCEFKPAKAGRSPRVVLVVGWGVLSIDFLPKHRIVLENGEHWVSRSLWDFSVIPDGPIHGPHAIRTTGITVFLMKRKIHHLSARSVILTVIDLSPLHGTLKEHPVRVTGLCL